jgi:hypothetical protein
MKAMMGAEAGRRRGVRGRTRMPRGDHSHPATTTAAAVPVAAFAGQLHAATGSGRIRADSDSKGKLPMRQLHPRHRHPPECRSPGQSPKPEVLQRPKT